ncbi:MAG: hypothetical protein OMM_04362 [Candidatus Magnetoglobus multicellularis str. Araruama]|uniref:Extensin-like C-terminal domain-containing protein n=1 Tax=Candidatus Magnetoglobus multicellularis str. Araruama TaxID=890399 RepID=A0A1V1P1U5_9BACT|nr:MAG: hypothetical protein OMM_04362 [Candidatus Magnetoglobus multicellularis str. Araruama]
MTRPNNYFKSLGGVRVHYDRFPDAPYGSPGKPYNFYADKQFQKELDSFFYELWEVCPYGQAVVITSAGTYVSKPGYHGKGRAFDLDAIFWQDNDLIMINYPNQPFLYLGIESVLRKHFGTVLTYNYNKSHRDHIHIDNGSPVLFYTSSKSRVLFVQSLMNHIFEVPVTIDGIWGPETESSVDYVMHSLDLEGNIRDLNTWLTFLTLSSHRAFLKCVSNQQTPFDLIQNLYTVINKELNDTQSRKTIECALNNFVDHRETQLWLDNFRQL